MNAVTLETVKKLADEPENKRIALFSLTVWEAECMRDALANACGGNMMSTSFRDITEDLIAQIRQGNWPDWGKYEAPRVLILEGLSYVAGKCATQKEILNLLNKRMENQTLTIIFSDLPPDELRTGMCEDFHRLLTH